MTTGTKLTLAAQVALMAVGLIVGGTWGGVAASVAAFWIFWMLNDG